MNVLLTDTSAWHRSAHPAVRDEWLEMLTNDRLAICDTVRLEVLYTARNATEYAAWDRDMDQLRQAASDAVTFSRARLVQRLLGEQAALHHRSVKIPDLLIAAAAEQAGCILWHYDEDFDRIAAVTGQPTAWLAPRGTL